MCPVRSGPPRLFCEGELIDYKGCLHLIGKPELPYRGVGALTSHFDEMCTALYPSVDVLSSPVLAGVLQSPLVNCLVGLDWPGYLTVQRQKNTGVQSREE